MPLPSSTCRILSVSALLAGAAAGPVTAQTFSSTAVSCAGLKLQSAVGVPDQPKHKYVFGGSCRVYQSGGDSPNPQHSFPVKAEALWDGPAHKLSESLTILGKFTYFGEEISGSLSSTYLCDTDPVIGKAACNGSQHSTSIKLPQLSKPFAAHQPITAGRTTLAEAAALSQQAATASVPPPPPPPGGVSEEPASIDAVQDRAVTSTVVMRPVTRSSRDSVSRPPQRLPAALTEIPLTAEARVALQNGRTLAPRKRGDRLTWVLLGPEAAVLRRFPAGSKALRRGDGEVLIDWGGGRYEAGPEATARLKLPAR
jgi:hypothetical protein